jgi:hypothetical protein
MKTGLFQIDCDFLKIGYSYVVFLLRPLLRSFMHSNHQYHSERIDESEQKEKRTAWRELLDSTTLFFGRVTTGDSAGTSDLKNPLQRTSYPREKTMNAAFREAAAQARQKPVVLTQNQEVSVTFNIARLFVDTSGFGLLFDSEKIMSCGSDE